MNKLLFFLPLIMMISACVSKYTPTKAEEYNPQIHSRIRIIQSKYSIFSISIQMTDCNNNKKITFPITDELGFHWVYSEPNFSSNFVGIAKTERMNLHDNDVIREFIVPANVYISIPHEIQHVEADFFYSKSYTTKHNPTFFTQAGKDYEIGRRGYWENTTMNFPHSGEGAYDIREVDINGNYNPLIFKNKPDCEIK